MSGTIGHTEIEKSLFPKGRPHLWIQWKGTDLCADFHCECGNSFHIDSDFCYFVLCGQCGTTWEVGTHIPVYRVAAVPDGALVVTE